MIYGLPKEGRKLLQHSLVFQTIIAPTLAMGPLHSADINFVEPFSRLVI